MILTNHTAIPDDYLNRILRDVIDAYTDLYGTDYCREAE